MKLFVLAQSRISRARVCRVELPSGRSFITPSFVAVGSNTLLKTVPPVLTATGTTDGPTFINTYHMMVQPGTDVVAKLGGLHKMFSCADRVLFTDSGGFQVFSLSRRNSGESQDAKELKGACKRRFEGEPSLLLKVDEEGVKFRSYRDGTLFILTPESSVAAQQVFGADVILPLDELLPQNVEGRKLLRSFERTHKWQKRSLVQHQTKGNGKQVMYGIVHGGVNLELRNKSVRQLLSMGGFEGLAVGGALGENLEQMTQLLQELQLPENMPRHLLGIADPFSLRSVVSMGFDSFDSVFATRAARHGNAFVIQGEEGERDVSVKNFKISSPAFREENGGLGKKKCECWTCRGHSAGLLHHLCKTYDTAVGTLLTIHNVHVMNLLVQQARTDIEEGRL